MTRRHAALLLALIAAVLVFVAACDPIQPSLPPGASPIAGVTPDPNATPGPTAEPTASPLPTPLIVKPAEIKADPVSLLAALFNPVFQAFLILMVGIHQFTGLDMGVSIILTTVVVRTLMVPLMRRQMVSMRRMQAVAPEIREIQRRYKNDRVKQQQATMALYKERGISQAGCLVALLPLLLILPMYQVVSEGLRAADLTESLKVFGVQLVPLTCPPPVLTTLPDGTMGYPPCIDSTIPWLGGILASGHQGIIPFGFTIPLINMTGISVFALVYTVLQLVASRMALPPHDPNNPPDQNARTQRALAIWLPLITILYGNIIPVGVFLYLIVSTLYQIVQQFLTTGWGGLFPLFGWTPAFAVDHKPRFPVAVPTAPTSTSRPAGAPARPTPERTAIDRSASANATIRQRGRQGRRGRRR
ncbi:MAG TPA: YidC/Oxa1 family membrane protein insertase [Candidatus Binatia bacterium]|nr:YidC/Oxa1 family membrane protein insertase [Candidatus Binatia bacterium]